MENVSGKQGSAKKLPMIASFLTASSTLVCDFIQWCLEGILPANWNNQNVHMGKE